MKIFTRKNGEDWIEDDDELKYGTVDLSDKGDRWEGDCLNGSPCGYGKIYDDNNNLVYRGFVFEGKKVCYGEEYHDNGIIQYQGTYMNDYRHGFGCMYDMRGELLYKGDWAKNKNAGFNVNIPNDCVDDKLIHNLVGKLTIGDNSYNDLKELILNDYPNLTEFVVGSNCFNEVESFELTNCDKLKELTIGDESMWNTKSCQLRSMWSIPVLTEIFLNSQHSLPDGFHSLKQTH